MGWTAYYQVLRDEPLREAEMAALADLNRKQRKQPWDAERFCITVSRTPRADRVIAHGWNKLAGNDPALLEVALQELSKILGGELRVSDDFGALARKTAPLVEVRYKDMVDPTELVVAPPVAIDASASVHELLASLVEIEDSAQRDRVEAQLAAHDAREVVLAAYAAYPTLGRNYYVRGALGRAIERLADPQSVASEFLTVWRNGEGTYYYGDMPWTDRFAAAIARVPAVAEQLVADIAATQNAGDDELVYRRAEAAIQLLAKGGHLRPLIETIRALRGKELYYQVQYRVFNAAHKALAESGDPRAVPTLLYFIGTTKRWVEKNVVDSLVKTAPDRVRPHVLAFARTGVNRGFCVDWLRALGGTEELALAQQLEARAQAPLEDRAVDVDQQTRHEALRTLAERKDKSTFLSLVLAESLDKFLRARTEFPGLPFSWWDWKDILPSQCIEGTTAKKLQWHDTVGKTMLGEQVLWPQVADIQRLGAGRVAEGYPAETLDFKGPLRDELLAEEKQLLATL